MQLTPRLALDLIAVAPAPILERLDVLREASFVVKKHGIYRHIALTRAMNTNYWYWIL